MKFDSKPREWDKLEFFGTLIKTFDNGELTIEQSGNANKFKLILMDATFHQCSSLRAIFAWLGHYRPNVCRAINRAAPVIGGTYSRNMRHKLNEINGAILKGKNQQRFVCASISLI